MRTEEMSGRSRDMEDWWGWGVCGEGGRESSKRVSGLSS